MYPTTLTLLFHRLGMLITTVIPKKWLKNIIY